MPQNQEATEAACLQAALEYQALGWSVIALCPPDHEGVSDNHLEKCTSPGKAPMNHWAEFQNRCAGPREINSWWGHVPNANVGVVMGHVSGVVGLDVDGTIGELYLHRLSGGDLPATLMFNTGDDDSFRYLYALPEGHPCRTLPYRHTDSDGGVTEPFKILGNGSQTAMPPSRHEHGRVYQWCLNRGPSEIEMAPAPQWLLALLANGRQGQQQRNRSQGANGQTRHTSDGGSIRQGGRESTLTAIAGAMRRYGSTREEIRNALETINHRCEPPLEAEALNRISRSIANYTPERVPAEAELLRPPSPANPYLLRMDEVEEQTVDWLWESWLPGGMLAACDGEGGVGKSSIWIDVAARLTRGDVLPDGTRPSREDWRGPQNVLFVCCEDSVRAVVKPRMVAAGCVSERTFYLEEVLDEDGHEHRQLELPKDSAVLAGIVQSRNIRLMVVDPLMAFFTGGDYSKDTDVRKVLSPLKRIAEEYGCTILYIRHWTKGGAGGKAVHRGGGSVSFVNAPRVSMCVGRSPNDEHQGILAWTKGNLSPRPQSLSFMTVEVPERPNICRVEWLGPVGETADDLTAAEVDREGGDEAEEMILSALSDGPKLQATIMSLARAAGLKTRAVEAASRRLGIHKWRQQVEGRGGRSIPWWWRMPNEEEVNE